MEARRSPLDAAHRALGAHMGSFAGWEMPISYAGTIAEHTAVRQRVGMFDVTHLGTIGVRGAGAGELLDRVLSNRMTDLAPGRARYTLILDDNAGIVDDIIVYAFLPGEFLVVPNASNVDEVERRLRDRASSGVGIEQLLRAKIAVQGPSSREALTSVIHNVPGLGYMRCAVVGDVAIARSGYTGEHGYEIFTTAELAPTLWEGLLAEVKARGGEPCGLAARDTLRLEMGYPLHGNDIDTATTPREAHLDWAVAVSKDHFVGKPAFEANPPRKELVGLKMVDRVIPRHGATVELRGRTLGTVTSGTFSPTLKTGIALAYVEPPGSLVEGDDVEVVVRGKRGKARVTRPPFVPRSPK
ncbi:MAG: glycine cleavage system aminomethyltransferase GcvT [Actinomycetota bacterium]